jgi:hypothetical protein
MEVGDNNALVVCDPHGILGQQPRPHPIYILNIIAITLMVN